MRVSPVFVLLLGIVGFGASVVKGQAAGFLQAPKAERRAVSLAAVGQDERRTSSLICNLSSFFSVDPDDAAIATSTLTIEGRGLLSCRNDQSFATELPVSLDLKARLPREITSQGEVAISGNSSSFVVPREITQIVDVYHPRSLSWVSGDQTGHTVLLRGLRHDLVIELKLASRTSDLKGLEVTDLRLRFDEAAPDLF